MPNMSHWKITQFKNKVNKGIDYMEILKVHSTMQMTVDIK